MLQRSLVAFRRQGPTHLQAVGRGQLGGHRLAVPAAAAQVGGEEAGHSLRVPQPRLQLGWWVTEATALLSNKVSATAVEPAGGEQPTVCSSGVGPTMQGTAVHCQDAAAPLPAAAPTSTWLASVALGVVTATLKLVAGAFSARSLRTQVGAQPGMRGMRGVCRPVPGAQQSSAAGHHDALQRRN